MGEWQYPSLSRMGRLAEGEPLQHRSITARRMLRLRRTPKIKGTACSHSGVYGTVSPADRLPLFEKERCGREIHDRRLFRGVLNE